METKTVLLTGISGFLGSHTAIQLLEKEYKVTGTLRNKERAASVRAIISRHTDKADNLSFEEAELSDKSIWLDLTRDKDFV